MGIADNTPQKGYCIYAHMNKINGKIYIGISKNVANRWAHREESYKRSPAIYNAFKKYGWDGFEHIVMWDNMTKEEACQLEKAMIFLFRFSNKSYNIAEGGEGVSGVSFSEERRKAMSEARRGVKHSPERVAKDKELRRKTQGKPVHAFDMKTKQLVKSYDSIARAAEEIGTTWHCIKRALNGKAVSSHGYYWSSSPVLEIKSSSEAKYPIGRIDCYDLFGNYIKSYNSTREAINEIGGVTGGITYCCNRKILTYRGFIWRKEKDTVENSVLERIKISIGL